MKACIRLKGIFIYFRIRTTFEEQWIKIMSILLLLLIFLYPVEELNIPFKYEAFMRCSAK